MERHGVSHDLTKTLEAARAVVRRVNVCHYPDDHETEQLLRDLDAEIEKAKQAA